MINFHALLPYIIFHFIVVGLLLWAHVPDGFYKDGTPWQRVSSWIMTIFFEPAFLIAIVLFLIELVQDSIRRERLLGAPKPEGEGIATWKLTASYFAVWATVAVLCVAIII